MLAKHKNIILISIIVIAVALNMITFAAAYPATFTPESAIYARDFSAYYIGGWRLFHNPTTIYYGGAYPGDYPIAPAPQTFKYAPSFLLWFSPFMTLSYQNAFIAFDLLQVAGSLALGFFVYKIVKNKNIVVGAVAAVIVLIEPLPSLPLNQSEISFLHYRFTSLNPQTFSASYYWGYAMANAHVLQIVFIAGALYFGFAKKPWVSAVFFALSVFDPRASLLALPLLLWYNRHKMREFIVGSVAFVAVTNLPFFFYHGIGFTFLHDELNGNIASQMYAYDWIPIYAIAALSIMELISVIGQKYSGMKR